jgi:hypothetical protein
LYFAANSRLGKRIPEKAKAAIQPLCVFLVSVVIVVVVSPFPVFLLAVFVLVLIIHVIVVAFTNPLVVVNVFTRIPGMVVVAVRIVGPIPVFCAAGTGRNGSQSQG